MATGRKCNNSFSLYIKIRTSLVVQWIRILPVQGTWVRSLVWGDVTHCGATKPMYRNC